MFSIQGLTKFVKENFKVRDILIIIGLLTLFFWTRTINLHNFPIFSDEGIYVRWAKTAKQDPAWRFISLTDGRQPLQTWVTIVTLKLIPQDPLIAGRLFGVISGLAGFLGISTLLFYLFGKRAAYIGALLYIFTPNFLFYDRIALIDSAVNASCIWILFFSILLVRTLRLDVALMFGMLSGIALLSKSTAQLFIGLSLFAPLVILKKNIKQNIYPVFNYFILYVIAGSIAFAIYNIQRLSPFFHYINEKNHTFILTFAEWRHNPFALFFSNARTVPMYALWEMGWILPVISVLGFIQLFKKNRNLTLYILSWVIIPYLVIAFFNKIIFPRYLLFFAGLFVIPAAYFLSDIKNKILASVLVLLFILSSLYFNYAILFNSLKLPFPPVDRGQYVEGISAVWGANVLMDDIRYLSGGKDVLVLAQGDFGLSADVLRVFTKTGENIDVKGLWPMDNIELEKYRGETKNKKVFIVFSHTESFPPEWPITLVKKYNHPIGNHALYLFTFRNDK